LIFKIVALAKIKGRPTPPRQPSTHRNKMGHTTQQLIEVEPTRIGALGVGTFLILAAGILYLLLCLAGTAMKRSCHLYATITILYGSLILFLTNAKRRSRWVMPDNVVSDVEHLWLTHILVGTVLVLGSFVGLLAWIYFDFLSVVMAKEIDTERDRRSSTGRQRFMF
jgi:hypothetical protein